MILIISSADDITTNDVIKWIRYFNVPFKRVSGNSNIKFIGIDISNQEMDLEIEIDGESLYFSDIKKIWYRRSWFELDKFRPEAEDRKMLSELTKQLNSEHIVLTDFFLDVFETKSLNTQRTNDISKLTVLRECENLEICTPNTLVTTSKKSLLRFFKENGRIISKNLSQGTFMNFKDYYLVGFTEEVTSNDISELPSSFAPMLFQSLIEKAFEIRVFYLDGEFYGCAIFSQSDEKTSIDFRNYNFEKPNRTPPYILPEDIKGKLHKLMTKLKLNSGSIDLIYSLEGEYVFLEVNPIGQFSQVSFPCNYNLEMKVAQFLCNK